MRILTIALVIYLAFIGGASYPVTNIFLRGLHHFLMTALLAGWLLGQIRRGRPLPATALDLPLLVLVGWWGVVLVASQDWRVSLEQSWTLFLHLIGLYILVDSARRRWVFEGLFLVAALVVLVSGVELFSWYFGLGFAGFKQGWWGLGNPLPPVFYRLSLAFNVATWLGNFVVLVLPLTLAWALTARKRDDRRALWLVSLGLVWVLAFSLSRGALLGGMAAVGVWALVKLILQNAWGRRGRGLGLGLLAIFAVGGLGVVYLLSQSRGSGDQGRVILWESALAMMQDHPVFGVGVYQYGYFLREYSPLNATTDHLKTAHNLYLNTAAEIGIPGLLLLLWLGGAFLLAWWRTWQEAASTTRTRLTAVLAALTGFVVQSLVDTFTFTSTLLPLLVGVAYVLAQRPPTPKRPHFTLRYALLVGVVASFVWLARIDLAQFRLLQSSLALAQKDYPTALEKVEAAQALDPHLRLYALQKAGILGAMEDENAILAYEHALQADPNFHVGWVNLAALYAEQGDFAAATSAMQRALANRPDMNWYWLKLGTYQEAAGHEQAAAESYQQALARSSLIPQLSRSYAPPLSASHFWDDAASYPARERALGAIFDAYSPERRLIFALNLNREVWIEEALGEVNSQETNTNLAIIGLGLYATHKGNFEQAAAFFARIADNAWVQSQLARSYLESGDLDRAEKAAKTALFLSPTLGREANSVLAALPHTPEGEINGLLVGAVFPRFVVHAYDEAVFGHIAFLDYLPLVNIPGAADFSAWFWLAERYAADNDPSTDPLDVYRAILQIDPYHPTARVLCACD